MYVEMIPQHLQQYKLILKTIGLINYIIPVGNSPIKISEKLTFMLYSISTYLWRRDFDNLNPMIAEISYNFIKQEQFTKSLIALWTNISNWCTNQIGSNQLFTKDNITIDYNNCFGCEARYQRIAQSSTCTETLYLPAFYFHIIILYIQTRLASFLCVCLNDKMSPKGSTWQSSY